MLRKVFGAALAATCGYAVADSVADSVMYCKCKRMVETRAAAHSALQSALGNPLSAGPWYNATVQITHDGHIATVTIPLHGAQRSSDVTVRVVRRGGLRSTLLYNVFGAAEWDAIVMQAVIGMGPGGIPQSMSLLQARVPDSAAGSCESCMPQQAQQGSAHP